MQIVLLGICPTRQAGGRTGSPLLGSDSDVALQPLPMYTVSSDNVVMTSVAATTTGRVFLGGSDGHLYELQYHAAEGWGRKRCQKVCLVPAGEGWGYKHCQKVCPMPAADH